MVTVNTSSPAGRMWPAVLAFLVLFAGVGRLFDIALHDPLLGYGNSYDMIRIQACHQLWPANSQIDITQGTPAAPLRWYRHYDSHLDVKCFPSSELVFTTAGIALANTTHLFSREGDISIQCVGFVKALILALTAFLAAWEFHRRKAMLALWVNALVFTLVLADPGITLYLNTFYTEFSAVYFLYLLQLSLVLYYTGTRSRLCFGVIVLALSGFAFSKPQHMPLAVLLSVLIAMLWLSERRYGRAAILVLASMTPLAMYLAGMITSRNEIMEIANGINSWGMLLGFSSHAAALLSSLGLPEHCQALVGAHWEGQPSLDHPPCSEIHQLSMLAKLHVLALEPSILPAVLQQAIPQLKAWTLMIYGNVEGRQFASISEYQPHLWELFDKMSDKVFVAGFLLPIPIILAMIASSVICRRGLHESAWLGMLLCIQWSIFMTAVLGDGFYDLSKHSHLVVPVVLSLYVYLLCRLVAAGIAACRRTALPQVAG